MPRWALIEIKRTKPSFFKLERLTFDESCSANIRSSRVASQCGYVVSTSAFRQGDPGSNPIAARKSCEVYPGLGILQP